MQLLNAVRHNQGCLAGRRLLRRYAVLGWAGVSHFTMLGWLYLLSYFKLFVTSTKYVPQARSS
jgi:hypothetical protein